MKLKHLIYGALFLGAFSLSSCDKDEVIEIPYSAEKIINLINQHQPSKIYIDFGTKQYEYSNYYIEDDCWLVTLVQYGSDYITKPQYWNLGDVSHFDILEEGSYFVLSFN